MYIPVGDNETLLSYYDTMCAATKGSPDSHAWYCGMATHLRKTEVLVHPPPPPEPPKFVAIKPPPESVAEGSSHEQWWKDKIAREDRNKKLMLLGAVGLGAYLILKR